MKLFYFLIIIFLMSCSERIVNISNENIQEYNFKELPNKIQHLINVEINKITKSENETYYSLNKKVLFRYERNLKNTSWLEEVNSNFHHFYINHHHFKLRGNKGHPFIFYENKLYYSELNIDIEDYKEIKYFSIDLNSYLNF